MLLAALFLFFALDQGKVQSAALPPPPDVVVLVVDDWADTDVDAVTLPNIATLAEHGVRFRRAYAHSWCAPTRDSLMRAYACGDSLGDSCDPGTFYGGGLTLPRLFQNKGYRTCHVGKWHIGSNDTQAWQDTPTLWGFDDVRMGHPIGESCGSVVVNDGVVSTAIGDDSIRCRDAFLAWWDEREGHGPRFAMVNLGAGHSPFAFPPASILPAGYPHPPATTNRERYEAELVGADHVIGEMLARIGPRAIVVFLGDNGTPGFVPGDLTGQQDATRVDQDPHKVKLSCYEDGVRVPLIVRAPGVQPREVQDLVHVADLLPTLRALILRQRTVPGSIPPPPPFPDSGGVGIDFSPVLFGGVGRRTFVFVHGGSARKESALIDARWKLLTTSAGVEQLFDLAADPHEANPLAPIGDVADGLRNLRISIGGR